MNNNETLARACKDLCYQEAFYGLYMMMLNKYWDSRVPTAGVSKNGINYQLSINEKFWERLEPIHKMGIMKHELLHICFFHLEKHFEFEDHVIANMAEDMEINQYIDNNWLPGKDVTRAQFMKKWTPIVQDITDRFNAKTIDEAQYDEEMGKVPPRGFYYEDYKDDLKLDPKAGSHYYYDKLKKNLTCKKPNPQLKGMYDAMQCHRHPLGHGTWKEFEGLTEAEKKLMKAQVDFHLRAVADQVKSRGTVPSELQGYIDSLDKEEPPKFDWKRFIRQFSGGSQKVYTKKLRRKYNKRFEDNPGLKVKPRRHILVAVDTSGSVNDTELKEFFHEIHHLQKTGSEVTVLQCDAAISSIEPLKRGIEERIKITGRGGTDFNPPCEYFTQNSDKYTCMIYFTDGECSPPDNDVRGRMLWVLSSNSSENNNLPGVTIKLPK